MFFSPLAHAARRHGMSALLSGMLSASLCCTAAAQAPLSSPWDATLVRPTGAPYNCASQPAVSPDLKTDGFYALNDPTHSRVDPVRMAAYKASADGVKAVGLAIVDAADAYRTTGSQAAAACALSRIDAMARANSLGGSMSSSQAYYVQGWIAGAVAIAYLKVRHIGVPPAEGARIAAWLQHVGAATIGYYDAERAHGHAGNNHLYWAGLELVAIGVAANDRADFNWGVDAYRAGVDQIAPDGTLPLEMARGSKALHYHLYALAPLVLIAEFGQANGMPLYDYRQGALRRLAQTSVQGLLDPSLFNKRAGVAQEVTAHPGGDALAWAPEFLRRYPDPALARLVQQAPTLSSYYMGGLPPPQ